MGTFSMTIHNIKKEERGEFSCVANNHLVPGKKVVKKAELKVNFKPEIRNFPRYAKFAERLMHQIELRCVAYGYPGVSIYWMKASDGDTLNNEEFIFDNEGKTKKIGYSTWESVLTIESVYNAHYTSYQCFANNTLGEDRFNISLTTKSIPEPPVNLEVTKKDYKTVQLKWEPGFDGGFQQHFETRIKEVTSGKARSVIREHTSLTPDTRYVHQARDHILNNNINIIIIIQGVQELGVPKQTIIPFFIF